MSARAFQNLVLPALLVGTSRQPVDFSRLSDGAISPDQAKAGLKVLALTGQALRFDRPAPPSHYAAIQKRAASRPSVPEPLRPILVRLFGDSRPPQPDLSLGMARALQVLRLQPHPFDFHRMEGFLRANPERLGPEVCAWIDRDKPDDQKRGYFDSEVLDDSNWQEAPPARAQRHIIERRRQHADAGRALVEAVWSNEGADRRFILLQALRPALCSADRTFLEGLCGDRSPRVRELAERYLSRLPGAAGQNPALKSVIERIAMRETGIFRKSVKLTLELPATKTWDDWRAWILELFDDVELDELAGALGLLLRDMIAAATPDRYLSTALTIAAFRQGDLPLARQAYEAMSERLPWLELVLFEVIDDLEPENRQALAEFLLRKAISNGTVAMTLARAHPRLEAPMSESLIEAIMQAPAWTNWSAPHENYLATFASLAAMCPPTKRAVLRNALARLEDARVTPILQFFDALDSLGKVDSSE